MSSYESFPPYFSPSKKSSNLVFVGIAIVVVAGLALSIWLLVRAYRKDHPKTPNVISPTNIQPGGGSTNGLPATTLGATTSHPWIDNSQLTSFYPPAVSSASQLNTKSFPVIPAEDMGRAGSDAAWWHNVDVFDEISQTAVSPFGGFWPAAPEVANRSRGDYYRGYGGWAPMPYNGGYLTYPSNFIPLSTTQISVTDLHPFCSKQR